MKDWRVWAKLLSPLPWRCSPPSMAALVAKVCPSVDGPHRLDTSLLAMARWRHDCMGADGKVVTTVSRLDVWRFLRSMDRLHARPWLKADGSVRWGEAVPMRPAPRVRGGALNLTRTQQGRVGNAFEGHLSEEEQALAAMLEQMSPGAIEARRAGVRWKEQDWNTLRVLRASEQRRLAVRRQFLDVFGAPPEMPDRAGRFSWYAEDENAEGKHKRWAWVPLAVVALVVLAVWTALWVLVAMLLARWR